MMFSMVLNNNLCVQETTKSHSMQLGLRKEVTKKQAFAIEKQDPCYRQRVLFQKQRICSSLIVNRSPKNS